jgi:hypothetical protein
LPDRTAERDIPELLLNCGAPPDRTARLNPPPP